jgi:hypothetical protein
MRQFPANIDLSSLDGSKRFQAERQWRRRLERHLCRSAADVIVGAPGAGENYVGAAYVVFGNAEGLASNIDLSSLNGTSRFRLSGEAINDSAGILVASAGDVNGDGIDDLIVGADQAGAGYVVFGKTSSGFASNIDLSSRNGDNGFKLSGARKKTTSPVTPSPRPKASPSSGIRRLQRDAAAQQDLEIRHAVAVDVAGHQHFRAERLPPAARPRCARTRPRQ